MNEIFIHQRENDPDTENFLQENMGKIEAHSTRVVRLLYSQKRYTAKEVNDELNMTDGGRRLREIFHSRKDCKKDWRRDEKGKRLAVEYWLEIPKYPTKEDSLKWAEEYLQKMKTNGTSQQNLFP